MGLQRDRGDREQRVKTRGASQQRKRYASPRLVMYGDLRRLTTAKGGSRADGGGNPTTKV